MQQSQQTRQSSSGHSWLSFLLICLAIAAAAFYFFSDQLIPPEQPDTVETVEVAPVVEPEPAVIAPKETVQSAQPDSEEVAEMTAEIIDVAPEQPALEANEPELVEDLAGLSDSSSWRSWFDTNDLARKSTVVVENLAAGEMSIKGIPIPRPTGAFKVIERNNKVFLDPSSYKRYDVPAKIIGQLDPEAMAGLYKKYLPLLSQAYAEIGVPSNQVHQKVMMAIDNILSTPVISGNIELKAKGAVYQYSNPSLEALPTVQKQILRMGPENAAIVIDKVAELKKAIKNLEQ